MSLRRRLFLALTLMVGLCLLALIQIVMGELKPAMRKAVEETLIDTSIMLAELARQDMADGLLTDGRAFESRLAQGLARYAGRRPKATVWGVRKDRTDHRIYVTDAQGIVLYDTRSPDTVGQDYSQWNDVFLTLQGEYGARTSPQLPDNQAVLYVAAPILAHNGSLLGVVSVGKPAASLEPYFHSTRQTLERAGLLLFGAALVLAFGLAWWHGLDVARLSQFARAVAEGKRVALPTLTTKEMRRLGHMVQAMRTELEGREHVERTVLAVAHELKSPLTAITGAVELLDDPAMAAADRQRFLAQVHRESARMGRIIDRLLSLTRLEARQALEAPTPVDLASLTSEILQDRRWQALEKGLTIENQLPETLLVRGEHVPLRQALDALVENALEFAPHGGSVRLRVTTEALPAATPNEVTLGIRNDGEPIPDYALPRLFERFYSLPRPDTGQKSSGLGLALAQEVATLHGGSITIENMPKSKGGGVEARLRLPGVGTHQVV